MSHKKQLKAFYDKQGLTGSHRRKAMRYDLRVTRQKSTHVLQCARLSSMFLWVDTKDGWQYWNARDQADRP